MRRGAVLSTLLAPLCLCDRLEAQPSTPPAMLAQGGPERSMPLSPSIAPQPLSPAGVNLDLATVVKMAVGNNTVLDAASIRLHKAQELIEQVDAQNRPQMRIDAAGYLTSYDTGMPSLPTLDVANPFMPGGGVIPDVNDIAGGFSTAFVGSTNGAAAPGGIVLTPGTISAPADTGAPGGSGGANSPARGALAPAGAAGEAPPAQGAGDRSNAGRNAMQTTMLAPFIAGALAIANSHGSQSVSAPVSEAPAVESEAQKAANAASDAATAVSRAPDPPDQRDNYSARVSVIQFLDVFGLIPTARSAARSVADFYALDVDRLENETALAAKNLYFNALFAQQEAATQEEQVKFATENVRIAQSRFTNKQVSQLDVLTAQTALASAQQRLTSAQNRQNLAFSALDFLLGYPLQTRLNLSEPALPPLTSTVDVAQTTRSALGARPEVAQANVDVTEANKLVKLAGAPLLPALGIIGSVEQGSVATSSLPTNSAAVGLMLDYSFNDGGLTRSRVRSAKLDVAAHELALQQLKMTIGLEVQQVAYNISNAQAQVASAQTALSQAQEAVRIANERYIAGFGTFLDVLNALSSLAESRTNLSVAQFLYQTSLAQLVRAMGGR